MPGTVKLHRVIAAPPEKVFRAFSDVNAIVKWFPPHGFIAKVDKFDVREGGEYRMSFTNFTTMKSHSFGGKYLEVKQNEKLRFIDKFDDPNLPGEMTNTITFRKVSVGTELNITQEGIPDVIPVEACYLGWQQCLELLVQLVEPNIPDEG